MTHLHHRKKQKSGKCELVDWLIQVKIVRVKNILNIGFVGFGFMLIVKL